MEIVNVKIGVNMKWLNRKREFVRRRPQLSLFISFIKGLIVGLLVCHFMGCDYSTIIMPTEEFPVFELAGTSYWQLQHEGEGDDRKPQPGRYTAHFSHFSQLCFVDSLFRCPALEIIHFALISGAISCLALNIKKERRWCTLYK